MLEENIVQPENPVISQPVIEVVPVMPPKKGSKKPLYVVLILIAVLAVSFCIYLLISLTKTKTPSKTTAVNSNPMVEQIVELSTRTYFNNAKPSLVLKEENKKNVDGTLETRVSKDGKVLSRQLFLKDKILSLVDGILTEQIFKTIPKEVSYKTTGDNFLDLIKNNPRASKETSTLSGKKVTVYTLGGSPKNVFDFVKNAYAEGDDNSGTTKIYIGDSDKELKKVETVGVSNQTTEEIVYENGPKMVLVPMAQEADKVATDEVKPTVETVPVNPTVNPTVNPQDAPTPASSAEAELKKEAKETKTVPVDPPMPVPPAEAISLFPLSLIPTATGYTNKYMDLVSKVFRIHEFMEKSLKETGTFDSQAFVLKYIKVKVDGVEIVPQNFNLVVDILYANIPGGASGLIRFAIPAGLAPGYHTVQVFAVDSWYLAPSIMVALPQGGENVLNLELESTFPPTASPLPDNQGFRISLSGKNLVKPFNVIFTDTQGKKMTLEDSSVEVKGTEELILTLPPSFPYGIYSLTIIKGSQTIYRPNYIAVSSMKTPGN